MVDENSFLADVVARIRNAVHPDRIILFGSRARGDSKPDSDYDLLVVAPSSLPRRHRPHLLYDLMSGITTPKDLVWWTPEEIEEWREVKTHFITTALSEGKVLYEKPA